MKTKLYWTIIGSLCLVIGLIFSEGLSLFHFSNDAHLCIYVFLCVIFVFSLVKILKINIDTNLNASISVFTTLLFIYLDREMSLLNFALLIPTSLIAALLMLFVDKRFTMREENKIEKTI